MLSTFPTLLAYGLIGSFLIRITLGIVLIQFAYGKIKKPQTPLIRTFCVIEGSLGILLIIGLYTQLVALCVAGILFIRLINKLKTRRLFTDGINYYFILFMLSISLLFLGAGAFALDYPL